MSNKGHILISGTNLKITGNSKLVGDVTISATVSLTLDGSLTVDGSLTIEAPQPEKKAVSNKPVIKKSRGDHLEW